MVLQGKEHLTPEVPRPQVLRTGAAFKAPSCKKLVLLVSGSYSRRETKGSTVKLQGYDGLGLQCWGFKQV